jgi:phosphate transport system substrate-binding protein
VWDVNWLDSQDAIAIVTAVVGLIAPALGWLHGLRVRHGKQIGYRVQLETGIHQPNASGDGDSTLVLVRIENVGTSSIHPNDYTNPDHGLEVVFPGRTVDDVRALFGSGTSLGDHFYPEGGIQVNGDLHGGRIVATRSQTIDQNPPLFSRVALATTVLLACGLLLLSAIIVFWRQVPVGCAKGELRVVGSTAFRPAIERLAQRYMADCNDSTITVQMNGSNAVEWDALKARKTSPPIVALSDGPKPSSVTGVREERVAIVAFALVVNDSVDITNLTTGQVRRIYGEEVTNWRELGGPNLLIRLVSRDATSGSRELLRQRILGGLGEPPFTSRDCKNKNSERDKIIRCELGRTDQVLSTVARVEGAIGYSELRTATTHKGALHTLNIDGHAPSVQAIGSDTYRFTEVEYAYANARAGTGSLTLSFLNYMIRSLGQDELKSFGHVPCHTPEGMQRCRP